MCVYFVNSVHLVFIQSLSKSGIRLFSVATVIFYFDAAVLRFSRRKNIIQEMDWFSSEMKNYVLGTLGSGKNLDQCLCPNVQLVLQRS